MRTYEEEGVIIPDCVINYYIVDGNNQPVSFSVLPLLWSEDEDPGDLGTEVLLRGTAVTGQKLYNKIIAWRPEFSYALPRIYVLAKDNFWMQLHKPRKSFEFVIMSTLVTVHCLHFLKWNLKADVSALWTRLHKAFSTYEVAPSKNHLMCHLPLIQEAAKRDKDLAKSELLPILHLETPTYEVIWATKKSRDCEDNDSDEIFDSVCILCDNGGEILCCEGKCLRSFHPKIYAADESFCESLGYSDAQIKAIQTFVCNNCQYQQHQCFVCGKLGSSDQSRVPEVFQCANAECGHFYHPNCVAGLLQPHDTKKTIELELKIHSGESFVCPAHKCSICMKGEDKAVHELQFAMCRRCPKAYHRKCLPSEITFTSYENTDQRAWDGLLPGRVLIYCMDHEILSDIGTPKRDHIIFPNVEGKMQTTSGLLSSKEKLIKSRDMGKFKQTFKSYLKAVETLLKILNDGVKLEDAKTVCEPQVFKRLVRWKKQLDIYLAPFLYGRHFTKVNKLELIVDKLKWYVQDGDTIVDFCCGSNDFSCLMRERLQNMGKICSFKNYDLLTPKNDFNFEQKDWMTVTLEELPAGSNLIMGLNPPFGLNGNLANKFINKALTFRPKLLILIVPIQTERLDRKRESQYDIIWEDHLLLSGKAVDVNGKPGEQHNNLAPSLYLWSRPDWTARNKTIAETCGHRTVIYDAMHMGKMDTRESHDGMYAATMGMQHLSISDAKQGIYHVLPQHPSLVSNAVDRAHHGAFPPRTEPGVHHGAFPPPRQYPTEPGVHHGASPPPRQYPTEPHFYPEWPGF